MSSISSDKASCVDIEASRVLPDGARVSSAGVRLLAVALAAAALAGCARSTVATNNPASLAASRQASPDSDRRASVPTSRRTAVVTKRHRALAAGKHDASGGLASFYTHGTQTASGERFDPRELTAAHRTLPFGTRVRVTNVATGRSVTVRINDRGPFVPGRVVDVSRSAAETLGMTGQGLAKVKLDVVR